MNPLEGKSINQVMNQLGIWVESGYPWSYIQEVLSYYRPDLNNQEFYNQVGSRFDRDYEGDWTNEGQEDWDYEQEPDFDMAALEGRELNPEEIDENLQRAGESRESENPGRPRNRRNLFGFQPGDSSPYDSRMRDWQRITDNFNTSLTVESDPEDVRILTEDYENRANSLVNDPLSDKEWSDWAEFTNRVRQIEQEREEKKAKKEPAASEKSYFDSPDNLTNKRSVITSSQPPTPEQMEQSIDKLNKQKFSKPGILR